MFFDSVMQQLFLKCSCNQCGGHIEFPPEGVGQSISCPHCGEQTELVQNGDRIETSPAKRKKPVLIIALASTALLAAMAVGILMATKQSQTTTVPRVVAPPTKIEANESSPKPLPNKRRKKSAKIAKETSVSSISEVDWNGLKSGDVTVENSGGRLIYAIGTIRNDSERQRFGVTVDLNLFDAQGKKIGSATDYTQVIEPKKEWNFKALITDPKTVRAEITGVKEN